MGAKAVLQVSVRAGSSRGMAVLILPCPRSPHPNLGLASPPSQALVVFRSLERGINRGTNLPGWSPPGRVWGVHDFWDQGRVWGDPFPKHGAAGLRTHPVGKEGGAFPCQCWGNCNNSTEQQQCVQVGTSPATAPGDFCLQVCFDSNSSTGAAQVIPRLCGSSRPCCPHGSCSHPQGQQEGQRDSGSSLSPGL